MVNPESSRVRARIVRANPLDEAAVAACALVGDNDAIEWVLLGPVTSEADVDGHFLRVFLLRERGIVRSSRPIA